MHRSKVFYVFPLSLMVTGNALAADPARKADQNTATHATGTKQVTAPAGTNAVRTEKLEVHARRPAGPQRWRHRPRNPIRH